MADVLMFLTSLLLAFLFGYQMFCLCTIVMLVVHLNKKKGTKL